LWQRGCVELLRVELLNDVAALDAVNPDGCVELLRGWGCIEGVS